jgi:glycerol-3-phosphate dehydrogenase
MAGDDHFQIIPRAGEYLLMDKTEGSRVSHTLFQCPTEAGKGILVTPTAHGNLLVGPTATQVASPEDRDTTADGLAQVEQLAAKTVPGLNYRQVITSFCGVRASTDSGDFILEASSKVPGLIHAAAIDSPGLTCCVSIAKYLVDILAQHGLPLSPKEHWCGTRKNTHAFQEMSDPEKDAYIKAHPEYGKIVCRCETISEGEILDAIRTNPPALDMDAVKRRTRSGMGRCQGGFCGPYVMELLAREMGVSLAEITKNGGSSHMLAGRIGDQS